MFVRLKTETRAWNDFIRNNTVMVFHTPTWKSFIEATFPSVTMEYWAHTQGTNIQTLFPLTLIRHTLGKKLISCGFIEYGGIAGDPTHAEALITAVLQEHTDYDYLEIRHGTITTSEIKNIIRTTPYKRFLTPLGDKETLWHSINKHKRKAVRKAEHSGVTVRELSQHDVNAIYSLYVNNMKLFGSPPLSKNFFINFFSILRNKNLAKAFGSFYKEKLISVLMGYVIKKRIHISINVSDKKFQEFRPNDLVHWKFMEWGCENGYEVFDWGRVREQSGQFGFKKKWASHMEDLDHYYVLLKAHKIPHIDPTNPRYKLFIKTWSIMPAVLSKRIGHWFRTGLGI